MPPPASRPLGSCAFRALLAAREGQLKGKLPLSTSADRPLALGRPAGQHDGRPGRPGGFWEGDADGRKVGKLLRKIYHNPQLAPWEGKKVTKRADRGGRP